MEDKDKIIAELKAENELQKDLYTDLLKIIEPYLSDFTGYDEKEQAFNIVLAVKELLLEFNTENERLKEEWRLDCLKCEYKNTKADVDKYRKTLQEIKAIVCGNYEIIDPQGRKDILKLITKMEEE